MQKRHRCCRDLTLLNLETGYRSWTGVGGRPETQTHSDGPEPGRKREDVSYATSHLNNVSMVTGGQNMQFRTDLLCPLGADTPAHPSFSHRLEMSEKKSSDSGEALIQPIYEHLSHLDPRERETDLKVLNGDKN